MLNRRGKCLRLTLLQLEFLNPSLIGRNGCTLDTNRIFLDSLGSVKGDLVVGLIAVFETKIVVLEIDVKVWVDEFVLDSLPNDSGHFIAIEFHDRILDLDLACRSHVVR